MVDFPRITRPAPSLGTPGQRVTTVLHGKQRPSFGEHLHSNPGAIRDSAFLAETNNDIRDGRLALAHVIEAVSRIHAKNGASFIEVLRRLDAQRQMDKVLGL